MHGITRGSSLAAALGMSAWTVPFCVLLGVHGGLEGVLGHGLPAAACTLTLAFAFLALHRAAVDHYGVQNGAVLRCLFGLMFVGVAVCAILVRQAQPILAEATGAAVGLEQGATWIFLHWGFGLGAFTLGAVLAVPVLWELRVGGGAPSGPQLGPEDEERAEHQEHGAKESHRGDGEPLVG